MPHPLGTRPLPCLTAGAGSRPLGVKSHTTPGVKTMTTVQRTKAPATSKAAAGKTSPPASLPHEPVALRAYEIWKERGCPHGMDQDHWFQAERELRARLAMRS